MTKLTKAEREELQRLCEKFAEGKGERDALKAKLAEQDANRAGHPGMCCGQCVDSIKQAEAKLAALVEAAHQSVLIAKDESRGGPCGQAEPSLTINAEVCRRMKSIRVLLTPAIAAARGGAS